MHLTACIQNVGAILVNESSLLPHWNEFDLLCNLLKELAYVSLRYDLEALYKRSKGKASWFADKVARFDLPVSGFTFKTESIDD